MQERKRKAAAMSSSGDTYIAGWKTVDDWRFFRQALVIGGEAIQWQKAFDEYFGARLRLRYLDPIEVLQKNGTYSGEGFSIVAIQCTLIEFLESTLQGITYRYLRKGETLGRYEYTSSSDLFVSFLSKRIPFANDFDEDQAKDFYVGVRCGLLHEARTKNGWRVWADGAGGVINYQKRIVYRDKFQASLLEFVSWYGRVLPANAALQEAFIRKFDSLCE
jgi:hypothetical protein